ncbi:hypothetical protein PoB_000640000 [Plakobranchus ocellatus]|uniref:DDE Tnp4 domain-containing protein n=1 Tax=Plakobranchus ocellatus TaxID=259542 RepID=A0AAV3Y9X5_9GAST|nr:hypothetical protein PoB_000640000 [Plakobranchus ocellatus]
MDGAHVSKEILAAPGAAIVSEEMSSKTRNPFQGIKPEKGKVSKGLVKDKDTNIREHNIVELQNYDNGGRSLQIMFTLSEMKDFSIFALLNKKACDEDICIERRQGI